MSRRIIPLTKPILRLSVFSIVICLITALTIHAQTVSPGAEGDKNVRRTPPTLASQDARDNQTSPAPEAGEAQYLKEIYDRFYLTYKLGPDDEIAVRVKGHPEHSLDKVKISPMGTIYHNLLGEIKVVGATIRQVQDRFTNDLAEYLVDPIVNVELIDAKSAKIGVLGDVLHPGIIVMNRPMKIVDVISEAGGITDTGSKSEVEVVRQSLAGGTQIFKVNVKRIYEGKAKPEENIPILGGDLVMVHGNIGKKVAKIASYTGLGGFLSFLSIGR